MPDTLNGDHDAPKNPDANRHASFAHRTIKTKKTGIEYQLDAAT
ncbi:MAG: hypothetical protein AB8G14_12380 [Ilumatobacter sp.]